MPIQVSKKVCIFANLNFETYEKEKKSNKR